MYSQYNIALQPFGIAVTPLIVCSYVLRATSLCLCLCNEDVQRRDRYLFVGGKLERGCSENVCLVFSFKVNLGNRFEHKEISLNSNAPCQRP